MRRRQVSGMQRRFLPCVVGFVLPRRSKGLILFFRLCFCGFSLGFLEESPSGTVEALRWKEDSDCEAFSGVVVVKLYG